MKRLELKNGLLFVGQVDGSIVIDGKDCSLSLSVEEAEEFERALCQVIDNKITQVVWCERCNE